MKKDEGLKENPLAVALRYNGEQDRAPRVVAKGAGPLAERIMAVAREHGVPVHEDAGLAGALYRLDLLEEIPPELYRAVAEVLAFLYGLDRQGPR